MRAAWWGWWRAAKRGAICHAAAAGRRRNMSPPLSPEHLRVTLRAWGRRVFHVTRNSQSSLNQGSPTPGPRTGPGPWTVRNRAAQREASGRPAGEPHLSLRPLPSASGPRASDGRRSTGPRCHTGQGPLLHTLRSFYSPVSKTLSFGCQTSFRWPAPSVCGFEPSAGCALGTSLRL